MVRRAARVARDALSPPGGTLYSPRCKPWVSEIIHPSIREPRRGDLRFRRKPLLYSRTMSAANCPERMWNYQGCFRRNHHIKTILSETMIQPSFVRTIHCVHCPAICGMNPCRIPTPHPPRWGSGREGMAFYRGLRAATRLLPPATIELSANSGIAFPLEWVVRQ